MRWLYRSTSASAGQSDRLVGGKLAGRRIDAEGEQAVEFRLEGAQVECIPADQVPIEGFQMAEIKDDAMAFRDGALIERVGTDEPEQFVGPLTRRGRARGPGRFASA